LIETFKKDIELNHASTNKMLRPTGLAVALTLAVMTAAQAHPGHGKATADDAGTSALHYATEPVHIASLIAIAGAMSLSVTYLARRKRVAEQA
jgi:hypothetical protein